MSAANVSAARLSGVHATLAGKPVLAGVDLTVRAGDLLAVVGPNGAGKTSLLKALVGLLPVEGAVSLGADLLAGLSPRVRAARIAYLAQDRRVAWNIPALELAALGAPFLDADAALERAAAALEALEMTSLAHRGVADMSGGERARVLLARALATDAAVLALDEPVAALDPEAQLLVLDLLKAHSSAGQAVIVTLHDLGLAARYADRVAVMQAGRIVADGAPLDALTPTILRDVFGLSGVWTETDDGPVLSARRHSPGSPAGVVSPGSPSEGT